MKRKIVRQLMPYEAAMMDTGWFLGKAFVAVLLAVWVSRLVPWLSRDTISMLFGLMMTLEPVAWTSVRSGAVQLKQSVLGAVMAALVISLIGYHPLTVALSLVLTLLVAIRLDFRGASPVAVFTAIYMTQYVQVDGSGSPSFVMTTALRLAALATGIAVAVAINTLAGRVGYSQWTRKRLAFLTAQSAQALQGCAGYRAGSVTRQEMLGIIGLTFHDIDAVSAQFADAAASPGWFAGKGRESAARAMEKTEHLRMIAHLVHDTAFVAQPDASVDDGMSRLAAVLAENARRIERGEPVVQLPEAVVPEACAARGLENLAGMTASVRQLLTE